jgi:tetratricopeptide (TPR) repeat protein
VSHCCPNKVLLIGWDMADWRMIRPLIDRGMMPSLARLVKGGTSGNLAPVQPLLGPMLWNSIATGKRADKHGICGFVEPTPGGTGLRPVSSTSRRCKAIWNILSQAKKTSRVVSWYASHPAEPVHGSIVTEQFVVGMHRKEEANLFPVGTFYPPSLEEQIGPLLVRESDLGADAILPFIPGTTGTSVANDRRMQKLASFIARTSSVHAAACQQIAQQPWDFMAVYYSTIGDFGRFFCSSQASCLENSSEKVAVADRDILVGCYRFHDMMLEALLSRVGSDTTVLLISGNGSQFGWPGSGAVVQGPSAPAGSGFGIACIHGPGIRRGESLYGATVLDVTPTILTALGLPVGLDMDGRPWLEIFDKPVTANPIESWESLPRYSDPPDDRLPENPTHMSWALQHLAELGHIEAPTDHAGEMVRNVLKNHKVNLALALTGSNRADQAIAKWEELATNYPDEPYYSIQLASCCLRHDRLDECGKAINRLKGLTKKSFYVQLLSAELWWKEGKTAEAVRQARELYQQSPKAPNLLNRIAELFLDAEMWADAESIFEESLVLSENNPLAQNGLARICLEQDRFEEAAEHARLAVGLIYCYPAAHFNLGQALHDSGREEEAIDAFEGCLAMGYEPAETHYRLAVLYRIRDPLKAKHHRDSAGLP